MELQLKNIGMIKEANVKLNGLTVIAGENDTGKSTVGKALFSIVKYCQTVFAEREDHQWNDYQHIFKEKYDVDFNHIVLKIDDSEITYEKFIWELPEKYRFLDTISIESPLIWNFTDFFRDIAQVESQMNIKLDYPYLMKDLNFKLHIKSASDGLDIKDEMVSLMGGEFKKDELGHYYFDKDGKRIELVNTATGIKMFGIFQILSQNNYLNKDTVLVLDEPEVHLHPKWQLEMAKIIVELVKSGVTILLNSHSPYMIEALKRYAERAGLEDKTNFYLAEDGYIKQIEESNSVTLSEIFEKLSEPFDVFEEMDSQRMEKLIHG
jgi:predicted ATPase